MTSRSSGLQRLAIPLVALLIPGCTAKSASRTAQAAPETRTDSARVNFVDATRESGLEFRHVNGAAGKFYYPETFGSGAGFIDYDGDGRLDIVLVNGNYWPG